MAEHNALGNQGEKIALQYLKKKKYKILNTNWRYQKAEIDIICSFSDYIIFVEVKSRSSAYFENPQDAVTFSKQKHIIRAANAYIEQFDIQEEARFDIISVLFDINKHTIEHIEDAFSPIL